MKAAQKKEIEAIVNEIGTARSKLEDIRDEIQSDYDEMSEKVQEGERGEKLQAEISELEDAIGSLEAVESIELG